MARGDQMKEYWAYRKNGGTDTMHEYFKKKKLETSATVVIAPPTEQVSPVGDGQ